MKRPALRGRKERRCADRCLRGVYSRVALAAACLLAQLGEEREEYMDNQTTLERSAGRFFVGLARVLVGLSFLALFGAWVTQATGGQIFGLTQQHLFSDATVLALLGICCFVDAWWHATRV